MYPKRVIDMKFKFLLFLISLVTMNCVLLNPIGLSIDREKGSESATRIIKASVETDFANSLLELLIN